MIKNTFKVKTIGEILKDKRLEKNLSTKQISEIIKIRVQYLDALENGEYSLFPSEVYIKGFLKNYAKFLGIDKERSLALYRRENKESGNSSIKKPNYAIKKDPSFSLTPEKIIIMIVILVTAGVVYYLANQVQSVLKRPQLDLISPVIIQEEGSEEYTTEDDTVTLKGEIAPDATLKLNGDVVTTNNLATFEIKDLSLNIGTNEFVLEAENQFNRKSTLTIVVNRNKTITNLPEEPASQSPVEAVTIIAEIKISNDAANIAVTADAESQTNRVYQAGETLNFTANESLTLQTPRPGNVTIIINGTDYPINDANEHIWEVKDNIVVQTK